MIHTCKQFHSYIHRIHFLVITGHASLKWLQSLKEPEGGLTQWSLKMQEYNYSIQHCPEKKHQNANRLSFLSIICDVLDKSERIYQLLLQENHSIKDKQTQMLIKKLWKNMLVENQQLYKLIKDKKLLFPHPTEHSKLVWQAHHAVSLVVIRKIIAHLQQTYFWESMYFDVEDTLQACLKYQQHKPSNGPQPLKLTLPHFSWYTVSLDVVGLLNTTPGNFKYILVAIDELKKWIEVKALLDLGTFTTAKFIIDQIIYCHRCPQFIKSDNGTSFTSHIIPKLNKLLTIQGALTTLTTLKETNVWKELTKPILTSYQR